ncbi:MAG: hypothetical protein Q4F84_01650 [Fibrobacter sp.]|nr:hypothetical protein [Fibrobacter sp.]
MTQFYFMEGTVGILNETSETSPGSRITNLLYTAWSVKANSDVGMRLDLTK